MGHTHLTACRRWRLVPAPAEYLLHAAHALPDTADEGSPPRTIAAVDDVKALLSRLAGRFGSREGAGSVKAVDGVDLTIQEGRTLGIVGESGSGKTTVARAIAGLAPTTSGSIALRGEVLARSTKGRKRRQLRDVQMVFQNPEASPNPRRSVGDRDRETSRPSRRLPAQGGSSTCRGLPGGGSPSAQPLRSPPGRALGRREAARGHRSRLRGRTWSGPVRRADLLTRRLRPRCSHEPAHGASARERNCLLVHLA